jgi:hypothetical protein
MINCQKDLDRKKQIFIPELFVYDLLKYEAPEVLIKPEGISVSSESEVRYISPLNNICKKLEIFIYSN